MILHQKRDRPESWAAIRSRIEHPSMVPLLAFEWLWEWVAYFLSRWVFLEVLEYLGSFSVLIAVIFYFSESGDRVKARHYQAWQVINTAQGKGGSGGRIEALQELNADGVSLVGVDLSLAFLQGVDLRGANLLRANMNAADLRDCKLGSANLAYADLSSANFRGCDLKQISLEEANLNGADLWGTDLSGAKLSGASLDDADLGSANLSSIDWKQVKSVKMTNLAGARNAPQEFIDWALKNGAIQTAVDTR